MIYTIQYLMNHVTTKEQGGMLDAMTAECFMLALMALGFGISGLDAARFEPMVNRLGALLLADEWQAAYRYVVEITPDLGA